MLWKYSSNIVFSIMLYNKPNKIMFHAIYWYSFLSRGRLHTVVRPLIFKVSRMLFTDLFTRSARLMLWARTQPCWKRYWHTYRVSTLTFWARYTGTGGNYTNTDDTPKKTCSKSQRHVTCSSVLAFILHFSAFILEWWICMPCFGLGLALGMPCWWAAKLSYFYFFYIKLKKNSENVKSTKL